MKLLDKIKIYTVDYEKELIPYEMPKGCSGSPSYYANDCEEWMCFKIEEVTTEEYLFDDEIDNWGDVERTKGVHTSKETYYYCSNVKRDIKVFTSSEIESAKKEWGRKSYEEFIKRKKL